MAYNKHTDEFYTDKESSLSSILAEGAHRRTLSLEMLGSLYSWFAEHSKDIGELPVDRTVKTCRTLSPVIAYLAASENFRYANKIVTEHISANLRNWIDNWVEEAVKDKTSKE